MPRDDVLGKCQSEDINATITYFFRAKLMHNCINNYFSELLMIMLIIINYFFFKVNGSNSKPVNNFFYHIYI